MELAVWCLIGCSLLGWIGWLVTLYSARLERHEMLNRLMARDYHDFTVHAPKTPPKPRNNWLESKIESAYRRKAREETEADDE